MFLVMQSFPPPWLPNASSDPRAWTRSQEMSCVLEETPVWACPSSVKLSWHRKPLKIPSSFYMRLILHHCFVQGTMGDPERDGSHFSPHST